MTPLEKVKDIKKKPQCDTIWVQDTEIDIFVQAISKALFKEEFKLTKER